MLNGVGCEEGKRVGDVLMRRWVVKVLGEDQGVYGTESSEWGREGGVSGMKRWILAGLV